MWPSMSWSVGLLSDLINEAGGRAGKILDQIDFSPLGEIIPILGLHEPCRIWLERCKRLTLSRNLPFSNQSLTGF